MVTTETKLKASELRLGNWVEFNDFPGKHFTKVTIDKLKTIAENPVMHTWYAIPLTPEILEKAGFYVREVDGQIGYFLDIQKGKNKFYEEGVPYATFSNKRTILEINLNDDDGEEFTELVWQEVGVWQQLVLNPLKHLHQLQNLYFALTGEELEINL